MSKRRWWSPFRSRQRPATAAPPANAIGAERPASASVANAAVAAGGAAAGDAESPAEAAGRRQRFVAWMLGPPAPVAEAAPPAFLGQMLERLDAVIASDTQRAALLPRAAHVVPQLMKILRDEHYSSVDVASRIAKDVMLSAEVIRSATGAYRRTADEEAGGEIDLARAVAIVGTTGLRRAIASVVLRPIFDAAGKSLSARAAPQIRLHAEKKARLASTLAAAAGLDPFDGYLAGLLHDAGWTATLRGIDGLGDLFVSADDIAHPAVVPQLARRRDTLFGLIVAPWDLSRGLDALAGEIGRDGLVGVRSPLGRALAEADRLAELHALAAGRRGVNAVPDWEALAKPVQDTFHALPAKA